MCEAIRGLVEDGRIAGEQRILTEMVCKKLRKNKQPTQIAEDLEEDEAVIRKICAVAEAFAPEYDCMAVYKAWRKKEGYKPILGE